MKIYFSRVATVPASEVELSDDQKKAYYYYTHTHMQCINLQSVFV